jgi:hypothetical protein
MIAVIVQITNFLCSSRDFIARYLFAKVSQKIFGCFNSKLMIGNCDAANFRTETILYWKSTTSTSSWPVLAHLSSTWAMWHSESRQGDKKAISYIASSEVDYCTARSSKILCGYKCFLRMCSGGSSPQPYPTVFRFRLLSQRCVRNFSLVRSVRFLIKKFWTKKKQGLHSFSVHGRAWSTTAPCEKWNAETCVPVLASQLKTDLNECYDKATFRSNNE